MSLACHDLRTPLATAAGFARTLARTDDLSPTGRRYVEMIDAAAGELGELLDELALAARAAGGRYSPLLVEADSLELASVAAGQAPGDVAVSGAGATVVVDPGPARRALTAFADCLRRHGGADTVHVLVRETVVRLRPVPAQVAPIVLGEDLRDLRAATGRIALEGGGASVEVRGDELVVELPATGAAATGDGP